MKEIVIATKNPGKAKEFEALFHSKGYEIKTLNDFPEIPDIAETGTTFKQNALIKAKTVSQFLNRTVVADDSGLIVDALHGEPGVYSARYAGRQRSDQDNNDKLIKNLNGVPLSRRSARFHCTLALVAPDKKDLVVEGEVPGLILEEPRGEFGFGYDPLFYVPELGKTMAELSQADKNKMSHRARALENLSAQWDDWV